MKISTEIYGTAKITGARKAVELCGKAGFDAWDFSMFDMHKLVKLPLPCKHQMVSRYYLNLAEELKKSVLTTELSAISPTHPFP